MDSRRPPCATVFLILTVLEPSTASARADQPIAALAPVETVLEGRDELIGVAVTADGTLYVSDRGAGIVYRLPTSGALRRAAPGLEPPARLAPRYTGPRRSSDGEATEVEHSEEQHTASGTATAQ